LLFRRKPQGSRTKLSITSIQRADCILEHFCKESRAVASSVYTNRALLFAEDDDGAREKLTAAGICSAADDDFSFVEGISALSLVASMNEKKEIIRTHLESRGHDLDEIMAQSARFKMQTSMPLVTDMDEIVLAFV
jgi:uncharacterized membrane protein affecting hemolysin expression